MEAETAQYLFDSAVRSQFAWRQKAARLYKVGIRTLESAAEAKASAEAGCDGCGRPQTLEENQAFEEFMLFEVGFFLVALAVENLLKAIWSGRNHASISNVTNIRKDLDGLADHDLARLAKRAGISVSDDEESLMNTLRDCILWGGRYPTPLKVSDYQEYLSKGPPTNRFNHGTSIFSIDLPMPPELDMLLASLIEELKTIPEENTY
ncbi:MAG: hypothetical protein V4819_25760 [Verrucomicrobiota bacterium]